MSAFDAKKINEIFNKTISTIEDSKTEIFDIILDVRQECFDLQKQLNEIRQNVHEIIKEIEELEVLEKNSRRDLIIVSKDFYKYKEEDIRHAYEKANELQVKLILKKQEEKELIKRRTDLEIRYKNTQAILEKAETLSAKIGVVIEFLGTNIQGITSTIEDVNQRYNFNKKIIQAQEEERLRLAREIHDGPAQLLANAVIKTEICEKVIDTDIGKAKEELFELKVIIRENINDIRRIIYNLRPMSIDDLGFIPAAQRYIEGFQKGTGIKVDFIILSQMPLEDGAKNLSIYRIIQEALNNVRKHSKAKSVKIKLEMSKKSISLLIIDDGIGFNIEELKNSEVSERGFGLISIKERVDLLEGTFEIKSKHHNGTKIIVNIPNEN